MWKSWPLVKNSWGTWQLLNYQMIIKVIIIMIITVIRGRQEFLWDKEFFVHLFPAQPCSCCSMDINNDHQNFIDLPMRTVSSVVNDSVFWSKRPFPLSSGVFPNHWYGARHDATQEHQTIPHILQTYVRTGLGHRCMHKHTTSLQRG